MIEYDETAWEHGNPLFGDWGASPRASDPDVVILGTPVGVPCLLCDVPIRPGDVGEYMPNWRDVVTVDPVHRECLLLHVVGHLYGICSCSDHLGLSQREAAIELARRVDSGEKPNLEPLP